MAHGDRAALGVHALGVGLEHLEAGQGDGGEGLVDLDHVQVGHGHVGLLERLLDGERGHGVQVGRLLADHRVADDRRQRLEAEFLGLLLAHEHQGGRAVVDAGGVAGGDQAVGAEGGLQLAELVGGGVRADRLVTADDDRVGLALGHAHGHDLLGELAGLVGGVGELVAAGRPLVHGLTGHAELLGDVGAVDAHVDVVEGAPQAVVDHRVDQFAVAHAVAVAGLLEQVRRVGHALHAAGDEDLALAHALEGVGHGHGAQARGADLVDGQGRGGHGQTGGDRRLAGRDLAEAGLQHGAHQDVVDGGAIDAGALDGLLDGHRAELDGGEVGQAAAQLAEGGAHGADDDGSTHMDAPIYDGEWCLLGRSSQARTSAAARPLAKQAANAACSPEKSWGRA
ncbi:hypothetical protein D3C72_990090 [compost metagenome]